MKNGLTLSLSIFSLLLICSCDVPKNSKSKEWRKEATDAFTAKDYSKATEYYLKLTKSEDATADDFCQLGNCYDNFGKTDLALQNYAKALELNPNSEWAYYERSILYRRIKKYDKAIDDLTKAIKLYPTSFSEAYYLRGMTYVLQNKLTDATSDFEEAIRIKPGYSAAIKALKAIKD